MPKSRKKAMMAEVIKPIVKSAKTKASVKPVKTAKSVPKAPARTITAIPKPGSSVSKQSLLLAMLQRPTGATVEEMAKATGWQHHSVQGAMSGVLKKRLGLAIASGKEIRGRVYRIANHP